MRDNILAEPYVKPINRILYHGSVIVFSTDDHFRVFKDEILKEIERLRSMKDSQKYLLVLVANTSARTFFIHPKKGEMMYQDMEIIHKGDIDIKIFQICKKHYFRIVKKDKDPHTKEPLNYSYVIGIDHEEKGFSMIPTKEGKDMISEVEEFRNGVTKRIIFSDIEQEMLRRYQVSAGR